MKTTYPPGIDKLISDRNLFNSFIYTPIEEAVKELELRKGDTDISNYISQNLTAGIPRNFKEGKHAILGRQLATPNFELMRFISIADTLPGFRKTAIVMHKDKFTPGNNETKYHLGKLVFNNGTIRGGIANSVMAVDFNENAGKKISDVKTIWGQSLVDFHDEFLEHGLMRNSKSGIDQFEGSDWLAKLGKNAKEYYERLLLLFLQNGILFENFLLKERGESIFTKEVFLPAFIRIMEETGKKPLIVSFLPIEFEGNNFWNYYPEEFFEFVKSKIKMSEILQRKAA